MVSIIVQNDQPVDKLKEIRWSVYDLGLQVGDFLCQDKINSMFEGGPSMGTEPLNNSKLVTTLSLIASIIAFSMVPAFSQGIQPWNKECKKILKKWETSPKHKAFATTNPNSGAGNYQACGASWGHSSKGNAEADALESCRKMRHAQCWIIRSE